MEKIKRIILLITFTIFITGCFDYKELNSITVISAIGIDYSDNLYTVTLEILDTRKNDDSNKKATSKILSFQDKVLSNCFNKAKLEMDRKPYYGHLDVLLLDQGTIKNKLKEVNDFFLRNSDIRNNFYIIGVNNSKSEDILKLNTNNEEIISYKIKSLIENNNFKSEFEEYIDRYIEDEKTAYIASLSLTSDNNLKIDGVYIMNNDKSVIDDANILKGYNVLHNSKPNESFTISYDKNTISSDIYESKVSYKIDKNNYIININIKGEISIDEGKFNYNNEKEYKKVTKLFKKDVEKKINNFIEEMKKEDVDLLGISNKYYYKYGKKNRNYFQDSKYKVNVNILLNKRGLIYEVNK